MASIPYRDIVGSSPFRFLIGPDKKEYTIHSSLVAHQSEPLNVLVKKDFKEAREQCVEWDDVNEETFLRFSQFVYTGNYDGSEPQKRKREQPAPVPENNEKAVDEIVAPSQATTRRRRRRSDDTPSPPVLDTSKKDLLWDKFRNLYSESLIKAAEVDNRPDDDYTDVFLSHAHIYVLADYWEISSLQHLTLRKLHQELMRFTLYEEGSRDIVELLKYSFKNTVNKVQRDPLRTLLCIYTACKLEDLWKNDEFPELVDKLDGFPSGLITELLHRMD